MSSSATAGAPGRTCWPAAASTSPICFVAPAWQRRGIGAAMLRTLEARIGRDRRRGPGHLRGRSRSRPTAGNVGQAALLEQAGYAPIRYAFLMVRPDLEDQDDAPLPPGLEIREVRPEHLRAIWDADQEAFQDHWGASQRSEEDWIEFSRNPHLDPTLWRVAWEGDQVAGQVRSFINAEENRRYGRRRGWVEHISVRRPLASPRPGAGPHGGELPAAPGARHDRRRAPRGHGEPLRRAARLREHGLHARSPVTRCTASRCPRRGGSPAGTWPEGRPGPRTSPYP